MVFSIFFLSVLSSLQLWAGMTASLNIFQCFSNAFSSRSLVFGDIGNGAVSVVFQLTEIIFNFAFLLNVSPCAPNPCIVLVQLCSTVSKFRGSQWYWVLRFSSFHALLPHC